MRLSAGNKLAGQQPKTYSWALSQSALHAAWPKNWDNAFRFRWQFVGVSFKYFVYGPARTSIFKQFSFNFHPAKKKQ